MPTRHNVNVKLAPPVPEDYEREGIKAGERIVMLDDNRFQVISNPRLMLHIENNGDADEKIVIVLAGNRALSMDYAYIKHHKNDEWTPVAGLSDGKQVFVWLHIPPGLTEFSMLPPYSYEDCAELVKRISDNPKVTVTIPGKSTEGRNLWLLKISEPDANEEQQALKRKCLIASRAHAGETAGNYCIEGILNYLFTDDKRADMYLQMFDIYICPMLNPDGVANGVRRHLENRADLNRDIETNKRMAGSDKDPELRCHFGILDELQPDIYAQIHNLYAEKHRDLLLMASPEHAEIFYGFMPSMEKHLKLFGVAMGHEGSIKHYCHENDPSCVACEFEFPWFGRTPEDMREVGRIALEALLNTKIWVDRNPKAEYHCVHTLCSQLKGERLQPCS